MSVAAVISAQHSQEYSILVRLGDSELRIRWVPALLLALPIPLFVALGLWQLDRAEQKRALAEQQQARGALPPAVLGGALADAEDLRHRRLAARGELQAEGQIYIDNRRHANRTGFHVITPLRIAGSDTRVLVNRGWIPAGPDGAPAAAPVPQGPMEIRGEAHVPSPPALALHGGPGAAAGWGERWPYLTVPLYAAIADYPVQPVVILQDPKGPGGFVRSWPKEPPKEGMHIGYALQWFAFAVIAAVLWVRLALVRRSGDGGGR